ncbi:MAG: acetyl-CoA hydrolase/transferase family protein [Leptospiraceae bacterium]|nr:acetyl-CoA hydrolase/transferase family protein [Leptospiraceae bacterium]
MEWKAHYESRKISPDQAASHVGNGQRIFLSGNASMPMALIRALASRADDLKDVELNHLLTFGEDPFKDHPGVRDNAWFLGPCIRDAVNEGKSDYIPIFLSEIARLVRSGNWPIHIAMIHVSPPDQFGYMSYGVECSVTKPCAEAAKMVIAQVNPRMPRALGDCFIHVSEVDYFVEAEEELFELPMKEASEVETKIGNNIASLIDDGDTLQLGIGGIPNAVLNALGNHKDLGIHTEMFSDGILPLLSAGVLNNQKKGIHRGKIITSFAMGSRDLYDAFDNNPLFEFHPSHYVNDPFIIAQNHQMAAINSAISIDLTGQVNSDSMGHTIYSGIGGQVDFIRGAARSVGGKPFIALPSTARGGKVSRIVPVLEPGAGVVTSRGDVHYVATEFGVVNLFGKSVRERTRLLISIAHPNFREELEKASYWLNRT